MTTPSQPQRSRQPQQQIRRGPTPTVDAGLRSEVSALRGQVRFTNLLVGIMTMVMLAPLIISVILMLGMMGCIGIASFGAARHRARELESPPAVRQESQPDGSSSTDGATSSPLQFPPLGGE